MDVRELVYWLRRLLSLDSRVFEEVRNNPAATIPGVLVVLVACLLAGAGGWLWWLVSGYPNSGEIFLRSAVFGSLLALVLWCILWLGIVYVVLTQVLRERAYFEQLMRVMGLAAAPLALMLLMFVPEVSYAIGLGSLVLTFGLTSVAIRSVTTADVSRVLAANFLGFVVWAAALTLLSSTNATFQAHAPGIFLFNSVNSAVHEGLSANQ